MMMKKLIDAEIILETIRNREMTLTQEQVSELSDFELNKSIWLIVKNPKHNYKDCRVVNYCNSWNDLMPLVVEHKINIHSRTTNDWSAWSSVFAGINENPQRALAECLFLVLQVNNKE